MSGLATVTVQSTAVSRVAYDPARESLYVLYMRGETFEYFKVPEAVYRDFLAAGSKGRFLNQRLKGRYGCTSIGGAEAFEALVHPNTGASLAIGVNDAGTRALATTITFAARAVRF
jgi:hypothetical protein